MGRGSRQGVAWSSAGLQLRGGDRGRIRGRALAPGGAGGGAERNGAQGRRRAAVRAEGVSHLTAACRLQSGRAATRLR